MLMSKIIVARFGGDAAANSESVKKMIEIIKSNPERRYVVVSAPGSNSDGIGITDLLFMCYASFVGKENYEATLNKISDRYKEIVNGLGMDFDVDFEIKMLKNNLKLGVDYVGSRGEYIFGKIIAKYLGWDFVDAIQIMFLNKDGTPDKERTLTTANERLKKYEHAIIPSFYGSTSDGTIKTFPRGDCDTAGALVACAVKADVFEKWSESAKVYSADPHVIPDAKLVHMITYSEAVELNYIGITLTKDDVAFMLKQADIPMSLCSIYDDHVMKILPKLPENISRNVTACIAGNKNFKVIKIQKYGINKSYEFDNKLFAAFAKHRIACRHHVTGIHNMMIVLKNPRFDLIRNQIMDDVKNAISPESITVSQDFSLIALVGEGMGTVKGLFGRIFSSLANVGVKAKMIEQGADELNIIIGVDDKDYDSAVKALYNAMILHLETEERNFE